MAHIILLFISPDFISSDFCYGLELEQAMKRHDQGAACVIPIILRRVHWEETPIGKLQALPRGDKPVKSWLNQDDVLADIEEDIRVIIKQLVAEKCIQEAHYFLEQKMYEKTSDACDYILRLLSNSIGAYRLKGLALLALKRYNEALDVYDHLICLDPGTASAYKERGDVLCHLQRYNDAFLSYKEAISFKPDFVDAYKGASQALREIARENNKLAEDYDEQARKLWQNVKDSTQEASE
jgi:tetratricopeptide (TPR) repeat protein